MCYNQFDFDYALESMDSVDLTTQANRLADHGDEDFANAVLEAYEDMYAALEAGDLDEAMDIYAALEEAEEEVEEDPDVARKAKRKALLKKVGKGAAIISSAAGVGAINSMNNNRKFNKYTGMKGGYLSAGAYGARRSVKYGVGAGAAAAALTGVYGAVKKRRDAKAAAAELEAEAQEGYGYFNR